MKKYTQAEIEECIEHTGEHPAYWEGYNDALGTGITPVYMVESYNGFVEVESVSLMETDNQNN